MFHHSAETGHDALGGPMLDRRAASGLLLSLCSLAFAPAQAFAQSGRFGPARPFDWKRLVKMASDLAKKPYAAVPDSDNAAIDFEAFSALTYGNAQSLAGNVRLFPTARNVAPKPVKIHLVQGGQAREVVDTGGLFVGSADANTHADAAGFRVMSADGQTDWLAFLGASYYRTAGTSGQYGLSARGLSIDTGLDTPEEFPVFTQFWLENTGPDTARIHALLDSPSATGAYSFDCARSDASIVQDVKAKIFLRKDVRQLGIAAASSMFWYDQNGGKADWRPEIHDSDGLALRTGSGERIWRPLINPSRIRLDLFQDTDPKAFGLIQRDRDFDHYQDDGLFYDRRPSLWIEPQGNWGKGSVVLLEMPTVGETDDNVAMFWQPAKPAKAGDAMDFAYRLTWANTDPSIDAVAHCVDSFEGPATVAGLAARRPPEGIKRYVFDFKGPALAGLDRDSGVEAAVSVPSSAIVSTSAYPVVGREGVWRAVLDLREAEIGAEEFRFYLKRGNDALSETVIKVVKP